VLRSPTDPREGKPRESRPIVVEVVEPPATTRRLVVEKSEVSIGSSPGCEVVSSARGVAPVHATERLFEDCVDIAPAIARPTRDHGERVLRGGFPVLSDGDRIELGEAAVEIGLGWTLDPGDPRVGTVLAGHRLRRRMSASWRGTRYAAAGY